jgi:tRNA modification GTPase
METITALSTPSGSGGISVVRMSGNKSFKIIAKIFSQSKKNAKIFNVDNVLSHSIHFGYIFDNNIIIDEVLISVFKKPNSFTGEDLIEISAHGSRLITEKIIKCILKNGARYAEPGEFTKRAFLNGRIDLIQAEAVAELINSETELAHSASIKLLEGVLSDYLKKVRQDIINVTSLIELELDFSEEDVEFIKKKELISLITNISKELNRIIDTYISGKIIREGVMLVIAGKPNSGKSSLFNTLLKSERAIVSVIPGTTRDYIQENLIIDGILFNLTDTAGLRASSDEIEYEGINRSFQKIKDADLLLYLIDSAQNSKSIDNDLKYFNQKFNSAKSILAYSKFDLANKTSDYPGYKISIFDTELISELKKAMSSKFKSAETIMKTDNIVLTNLRHEICLKKVIESLENAVKSIGEKLSGEFISVDLRSALNYLGEITGEVTNDDILNNIFRNFCIGK